MTQLKSESSTTEIKNDIKADLLTTVSPIVLVANGIIENLKAGGKVDPKNLIKESGIVTFILLSEFVAVPYGLVKAAADVIKLGLTTLKSENAGEKQNSANESKQSKNAARPLANFSRLFPNAPAHAESKAYQVLNMKEDKQANNTAHKPR